MEQVQSFICEFEQKKKVSFLRRPLVSQGRMYFRGRRLLWETTSPEQSFLALEEDQLRIYHPGFQTLEIYPLTGSEAAARSVPGLTTDVRELQKLYQGEILERDEQHTRLRFTPRATGDEAGGASAIRAIEVTLGPDDLLRAWKLEKSSGDELVLDITSFQRNAEVTDEQLELVIPAGVKVVDYRSKARPR